MKQIELSIIMLSYNRLPLTRRALPLIQKAASGLKAEIIVVDNASTDGTREYLLQERNDQVRLVLNDNNRYFSGGNNDGLDQAKGKMVLFTQNDFFFSPHSLRFMMRAYDSLETCGLLGVGGGWVSPSATIIECTDWWREELILFDYLPVDFIAGCCVMASMDFLSGHGIRFDEKYKLYYEDIDLSHQAVSAGKCAVMLNNALTGTSHIRSGTITPLLGAEERECIRDTSRRYYLDKWGTWLQERPALRNSVSAGFLDESVMRDFVPAPLLTSHKQLAEKLGTSCGVNPGFLGDSILRGRQWNLWIEQGDEQGLQRIIAEYPDLAKSYGLSDLAGNELILLYQRALEKSADMHLAVSDHAEAWHCWDLLEKSARTQATVVICRRKKDEISRDAFPGELSATESLPDKIPWGRCLNCGGELFSIEGVCVCGCGARYPVLNGVLILNNSSVYYGEIKSAQKRDLIRRMESGEPWRNLVWSEFKDSYPFLHHIIVDETRNDFSTLLPVNPDARVLDLGAGWGTTSCHFARQTKEVIALDATLDRAEFVAARCKQDKIDNIRVACANILDKPFVEHSFDIVIMNGVLEWVGASTAELKPREAQLAALKEVRRILKPDGALYIGIENSQGYRYILGGMDDHTGIPHISYHERDRADEISLKHLEKNYTTYTYDQEGYQELLAEAGFARVGSFYPWPDYKHVNALFPVDDPRPLAWYYSNYHESGDADSETERVRSLELRALNAGCLGHHASSYSIVAGAADSGLFQSILAYVKRYPATFFPDKQETARVTGMQLSGTSGKVFARGRLKTLIFCNEEHPEYVALHMRSPGEDQALRREASLIDNPLLRQSEAMRLPNAVHSTLINGRLVVFQRWLSGKTLTSVLAETSKASSTANKFSLTEHVRNDLAVAAGLLSTLAETQSSLQPDETLDRLAGARQFIRQFDLAADEVVDFMAARTTDLAPCLVHGDFTPWNVLTDANELPGIIDWELAFYGRLGCLDWLRFAWGYLYDLSRLNIIEGDWRSLLREILILGEHPLSPVFGKFLREGICCTPGSPEIAYYVRFFLVCEGMLQLAHSQTISSVIIKGVRDNLLAAEY